MKKLETMDGMTAAAYAAYALSDAAMIFPITPASHMAETVEGWSVAGQKNLFGQPVRVVEMQSEKGVAGSFHGSLAGGALTSTFTASQGLMLMIPNLYKLSGELLPGVLHVTSRSLAAHALSIFGDHQDVMAVRATGVAMLASASVQECMDLSLVAHLAAIEGSLPFVHFFDGFRTSDQLETIEAIEQEDMAKLVDWDKILAFRKRCMEPERPEVRGTAQNPDIYFQNREAANSYYDSLPAIVQKYMDQVGQLTGRTYHLFDYVGAPDAQHVIITIASSCQVVEETVNHLVGLGKKVGLVKVRLYRPFSTEAFVASLPESVETITCLDRTKEPGSQGEPLLQDVMTALYTKGRHLKVYGGRYGLSSKDFTPAMAKAVFDNAQSKEPLERFTVGIDDDVTHLSLPVGEPLEITSADKAQCIFYGFGSDGTVGANKEVAKIIAGATQSYAQSYSWFDSKKSGGVTISYLRFSDQPISSPYLITASDYVACHKDSYVQRGYKMLSTLKDGGTFVLNAGWTPDELESVLPAELKRAIASKHIQFYLINATKIAEEVGLGTRINMIMETAFFKLTDLMNFDTAIDELKKNIKTLYVSKGQEVIGQNMQAIDRAIAGLQKIDYPDTWALATDMELNDEDRAAHLHKLGLDRGDEALQDYYEEVFKPMDLLEGDDLPVSKMNPAGFAPLGSSGWEKRAVAYDIPEWKCENCIQCYQCSFVCPHGAIRPYLATDEELEGAPETYETKPATLKGLKGLHFRIQVYPEDCVGCGSCAHNCPAPGKALFMKKLETQLETQKKNLQFAQDNVSLKDDLVPKTTVAGTQLQQPLLQFSGACAGCGETPYVKLLTQLFGDRLIMANATGCSSIWGAYAPTTPYTYNKNGHGPAWGNSLFEDNSEFGYGIARAIDIRRQKLVNLVQEALDTKAFEEIEGVSELLTNWLNDRNDPDKAYALGQQIQAKLRQLLDKAANPASQAASQTAVEGARAVNEGARAVNSGEKFAAWTSSHVVGDGSGREGAQPLDSNCSGPGSLCKQILDYGEMFGKKSVWAVGGDGWAYDIDYDGIDEVLALGENINILVLDTEGYSNTGGELSKATQLGSVSGFSLDGKPTPKKNMGRMMMDDGYVYVAQVCLGANMQQTITALREAEAYDGPSIVICLCPCISWGIREGMSTVISASKQAVKAGYWPLFRFNPALEKEGKNPLIIDYKAPDGKLADFLNGQNRYASLGERKPQLSARLQSELAKDCDRQFTILDRTVEVYAPDEAQS